LEKKSPGIISLAPNQYRASINNSVYTVTLLGDTKIQVDKRTYAFDLVRSSQKSFSLLLDDSVFEILSFNSIQNGEDKSFQMRVNGGLYNVIIEDHRSLVRKNLLCAQPQLTSVQEIKAPMPGKVVRIEVKEREAVKQGMGLLVLEAMKMENEIKSTVAGSVEKIFVDAGTIVEKGEVLLSIKPK
jgi:biotin carboxyl carrier protein